MKQRGCLHIYTGDGKGKTTAALGLALRASGAGLSVCFIQFLKARPTGEIRALRRLAGVCVLRFGGRGFVRRPTLADRTAARRGLAAFARALAGGAHDLVVGDELCTAAALGLVSEEEVLEALARRAAGVEAVLTGRGAGRALLRAADLVTEMRAVRHYYDRGRKARKGIEY